jgi:hypothetical protein
MKVAVCGILCCHVLKGIYPTAKSMKYDSNKFTSIVNGNGASVIYKDNNMKSSHGAGIP